MSEPAEASKHPRGREGMESLVTEIMQLIDARADDPRLRWSPDRMTVRVLYSKLVLTHRPRTDAQGHRARFGDAWLAAMAEHGWRPTGPPGLFTRAAPRPN
jgi:hypothetical protein